MKSIVLFPFPILDDYSSHYPEIAPAERPVSVILALDPFEIQYLPHISLTRGDIVHLTVPAGHAIIFTDACLHAGGANNSTKTLFRLFGYMVSTTAHFPVNKCLSMIGMEQMMIWMQQSLL